jgi:hypothetical protein
VTGVHNQVQYMYMLQQKWESKGIRNPTKSLLHMAEFSYFIMSTEINEPLNNKFATYG